MFSSVSSPAKSLSNVPCLQSYYSNADSVLETTPNNLFFVKPLEVEEEFSDFLEAVQKQERSFQSNPNSDQTSEDAASTSPPTRYAQTQNSNLPSEYASLYPDVPKDGPPFARIALNKTPDAINFWLGNSHSVTALHKDNYENIYVQVVGQKHFVLLPPVEAPCVNEMLLDGCTYALRDSRTEADVDGNGLPGIRRGDLGVRRDVPEIKVPFACWDPDDPTHRATSFSNLSRPLRVTLEPGDMLYLPAMWYHKVSQSCSEEGICVAVNYWYDMDFEGSFWSMAGFVRSAGLAVTNPGLVGETKEWEEADGDGRG